MKGVVTCSLDAMQACREPGKCFTLWRCGGSFWLMSGRTFASVGSASESRPSAFARFAARLYFAFAPIPKGNLRSARIVKVQNLSKQRRGRVSTTPAYPSGQLRAFWPLVRGFHVRASERRAGV